MSLIRNEIVQEALSWEGTPYHHQAGLKGVGVDCAYFIGHVAKNIGLIDEFVVEPYSNQWHLHNKEEKMLNILDNFGCKISYEPKAGDILAFKYGRVCSHLGILLDDYRFIHSSLPHGQVIIEELKDDYLERLKYVYEFPGVKNDN